MSKRVLIIDTSQEDESGFEFRVPSSGRQKAEARKPCVACVSSEPESTLRDGVDGSACGRRYYAARFDG